MCDLKLEYNPHDKNVLIIDIWILGPKNDFWSILFSGIISNITFKTQVDFKTWLNPAYTSTTYVSDLIISVYRQRLMRPVT